VSEIDENNNASLGWFVDFDDVIITNPAPVIDLSGKFFDIRQEPLQVGNTFDIHFNIENTQAGNANSFVVDIYLSDNQFISSSDHKLRSYTVESLAGNSETGTLQDTLTLPDQNDLFWQDGDEDNVYYIGAIIDSENQVAEVDELNNSNHQNSFADWDDVSIDIISGTSVQGVSAQGFTPISQEQNLPEIISQHNSSSGIYSPELSVDYNPLSSQDVLNVLGVTENIF